jgi:hypothetical protein
MKTIEEWFTDHLPADIGALAIRNTDDILLSVEMSSLSKAIRDSFVWYSTPQGFQFWREVFEDVKAREDFMASKDVENFIARKSININKNKRRNS